MAQCYLNTWTANHWVMGLPLAYINHVCYHTSFRSNDFTQLILTNMQKGELNIIHIFLPNYHM